MTACGEREVFSPKLCSEGEEQQQRAMVSLYTCLMLPGD